MDWNVVVTVRRDFGRALGILRNLGVVERTGLYNVLVMRVRDVRALLEQIANLPEDAHFFDTISHVVPVTHKFTFTSADEFERKARDIVLAWAPQLEGRSFHVRMRRRGHKGELHGSEIERELGDAVLAELARRGRPGRYEIDDPELVIAIETVRDQAGLALWTRRDLQRYPFLRAAIERGGGRHGSPPESAPSREMLAAMSEIAPRARTEHPATAAELASLLGELEPGTLEKLLATGATLGEVAEAVSAIEDEETAGEAQHAPSTAREAAVRAILEDRLLEEFEEQQTEREIVRV
jgi:tRNA(Ser,Leu) C12 N-acetylase TAN1